MVAALPKRNARGFDRRDRAHGVAFDAGNLHQVFDGVASYSEVVFSKRSAHLEEFCRLPRVERAIGAAPDCQLFCRGRRYSETASRSLADSYPGPLPQERINTSRAPMVLDAEVDLAAAVGLLSGQGLGKNAQSRRLHSPRSHHRRSSC